MLNQILIDEINTGYQSLQNTILVSVNGVKIKNLAHLAQIVDSCTDTFVRFDLERERYCPSH